MTNTTSGSKEKKRKKKAGEKFLATAPGTKLHRVEFIETQKYINGVRNERGGELVIRALNDEERDYLANFNRTFEHANFDNNEEFLNLSAEERSEIDHQDYARRMDLYFVAKSSGQLISCDIPEFDKITSEAEKDIEWEDLELSHLDNKKPKKELRRRRVKV